MQSPFSTTILAGECPDLVDKFTRLRRGLAGDEFQNYILNKFVLMVKL
jgi:hypothetical protein